MSSPDSNPVGCCSSASRCCPDIADNLVATLTVFGTCPCLGGSTAISLNAAGEGEWHGSGAFGGCGMDVELRFYCLVVQNPPPGQVIGWRLDGEFSNDCLAFSQLAPQSESCDPANFVFRVGTMVTCCSQTMAGMLEVTITD